MLARILIDVCWIEESVKVDVRLLMFSYRVQSICLPKVSISFKGDIRPLEKVSAAAGQNGSESNF